MPDIRIASPSATGRVDVGSEQRDRRASILLVLVALVVVMLAAYALKLTYSVMMPLTLAFFLTVLVYPIHRWLSLRLPWWLQGLSLVVALVVVVAALSMVVGAVWLAVSLMTPKLPGYIDQLQQQWHALQGWAADLGLPVGSGEPGDAGEPGEDDTPAAGGDIVGTLLQTLETFATSVLSFVTLLLLALFFMVLMLSDVPRWRDKARNALPDDRGGDAVEVVRIVAQKVRRFLLVRTLIGAIAGTIAGTWLWLLGVDLALVWGLLFFVFNYIPNIGSVIAAVPPTLIALVQFGPVWTLVTVAGLALNEQFTGNFLDPKLQGRNLDIAPLVVLVSVIFWTWVWGVAGALLAVPITVTLMIICTRIDALRPVALMLSGSRDLETMDENLGAAE